MIRKFPEKQMTAADFALLKRGRDIDLHTCPIGTWFVCKPSEHLPDITVVGQVVEPEKMFENQWGAGMSLPLRGINRYVLDLV